MTRLSHEIHQQKLLEWESLTGKAVGGVGTRVRSTGSDS